MSIKMPASSPVVRLAIKLPPKGVASGNIATQYIDKAISEQAATTSEAGNIAIQHRGPWPPNAEGNFSEVVLPEMATYDGRLCVGCSARRRARVGLYAGANQRPE